jgi:hypothetical protein
MFVCVCESPLAYSTRGKLVLLCVTERGKTKVPDQGSEVRRTRARERAKARKIQSK